MYPHVIKRWNLSWCNTQNAGIVKHGVMGDKRKIRTPKVRESFFKPMNLLARFEWKFNQCTYLFNPYLLWGNQIKSRETRIKNPTRKEHGHGKGIQKLQILPDAFSSILAKQIAKNIHLKMWKKCHWIMIWKSICHINISDSVHLLNFVKVKR